MKQLLTTLYIVLCASTFTFAQQVVSVSGSMPRTATVQKPTKVIDNSLMQVTYKVRSITDSLAPDKVAEDDMILQIGASGISKFYVDTRIQDSIIQSRISAARMSGSMTIQPGTNLLGDNVGSGNRSIIFKNWPNKSITVTDRVVTDTYSYTEPSNQIKWQILPNTDTILSYLCQKAMTTFRGRNYEAWFASDIPIGEGPWKFSGLPGLILKVYDTREHYVFECIGMEQSQVPMEYADLDYFTTSRRNLARVSRRFYEDPIAATRGAGSMEASIRAAAIASTNDPSKKRAYNPIELDY